MANLLSKSIKDETRKHAWCI